jgi:hypothetical protein
VSEPTPEVPRRPDAISPAVQLPTDELPPAAKDAVFVDNSDRRPVLVELRVPRGTDANSGLHQLP